MGLLLCVLLPRIWKGLWHKIWIGLKWWVLFERPWSEDGLAYIHIFVSCALNFYWNKKLLTVAAPLLFCFSKAFENWPVQILGYKISWSCTESFWKPAGAYLAHFLICIICFPWTIIFWKASSAALATFENLPGPILLVFERFQQIQKLLALKQQQHLKSVSNYTHQLKFYKYIPDSL